MQTGRSIAKSYVLYVTVTDKTLHQIHNVFSPTISEYCSAFFWRGRWPYTAASYRTEAVDLRSYIYEQEYSCFLNYPAISPHVRIQTFIRRGQYWRYASFFTFFCSIKITDNWPRQHTNSSEHWTMESLRGILFPRNGWSGLCRSHRGHSKSHTLIHPIEVSK